VTATTANGVGPLIRGPATWYAFLLSGIYLYLLNGQGNVFPFLQEEFGLSYREVSLHSSAIAVGVIVIGLFGDRLLRATGRRMSLFIGTAGLAVSILFLCLAPAAWASILSCLLMGLFGTLIPAIMPPLLADIHGARRTEAYAGQAIIAYMFALAVPLVTGFCIWIGLGWRTAMLAGALAAVAVTLWYRNLPIVETATPQRQTGGAPLPAAFWGYWALNFACSGIEFCMIYWAPSFFERVVGFGPAAAATAASGFPLGMLVGRIALNWLVRRFEARTLLLASLALSFVGFFVYWGFDAPAISVAGVFITGLGVAALYPLAVTFSIGAAREARDRAGFRMTISYGSALLLLPIALGALADQIGLGPAHLVLPVIAVLGFACFFVAENFEKRAARR
jgi:fucose permease